MRTRLLVAAAPAEAQRDAAALLADGSWADVRYNDTSRTGSWSPHVHLQRMQNMAAAVRATNDSSLALATNRAIEFWLRRDPRSLNWYWNELAVPSQIADTALLFQPWVSSPHTLTILVKFMERAVYADRTGANLDAELLTAITRAAIQSNHTLMQVAFNRLWEEIRVVQPTDPACISPPHGSQGCATDGIQIDSSFHQVRRAREMGERGRERQREGAERRRETDASLADVLLRPAWPRAAHRLVRRGIRHRYPAEPCSQSQHRLRSLRSAVRALRLAAGRWHALDDSRLARPVGLVCEGPRHGHSGQAAQTKRQLVRCPGRVRKG